MSTNPFGTNDFTHDLITGSVPGILTQLQPGSPIRIHAVNDFLPALRDLLANVQHPAKNKKNPAFNTKYADLSAVIDTNAAVFAEHEFFPISTTRTDERGMTLTIRLQHVDGGWIEGDLTMPKAPNPQGVGTALTYARRYLLSTMLNITSEDDTDGAGHDTPRRAPQAPSRAAKQPEKPQGPAAPEQTFRSPQEAAMRAAMESMAKEELVTCRTQFKAHFGATLSQLERARHQEAAEWLSNWMADRAEESSK